LRGKGKGLFCFFRSWFRLFAISFARASQKDAAAIRARGFFLPEAAGLSLRAVQARNLFYWKADNFERIHFLRESTRGQSIFLLCLAAPRSFASLRPGEEERKIEVSTHAPRQDLANRFPHPIKNLPAHAFQKERSKASGQDKPLARMAAASFFAAQRKKRYSEQPEPAPKKNISPCTKKNHSYICTRFKSHSNAFKYLKISGHEQKNVSTIEKEKKEQARFYGENGFCEWS